MYFQNIPANSSRDNGTVYVYLEYARKCTVWRVNGTLADV